MNSERDSKNNCIFRDCFSSSILQRLSLDTPRAPKGRSGKNRKNASRSAAEETYTVSENQDESDASELVDFIDVSLFCTIIYAST